MPSAEQFELYFYNAAVGEQVEQRDRAAARQQTAADSQGGLKERAGDSFWRNKNQQLTLDSDLIQSCLPSGGELGAYFLNFCDHSIYLSSSLFNLFAVLEVHSMETADWKENVLYFMNTQRRERTNSL